MKVCRSCHTNVCACVYNIRLNVSAHACVATQQCMYNDCNISKHCEVELR